MPEKESAKDAATGSGEEVQFSEGLMKCHIHAASTVFRATRCPDWISHTVDQ
jgi:hypothetical protein